jgi:hypothetical protein
VKITESGLRELFGVLDYLLYRVVLLGLALAGAYKLLVHQ